ncbi:hypothetical protein [Caballeronia sp. BR00000012568055]|uniref:hypothetical protein n=1 Tax=Caballeronia sp. BR00000012568055 TaxID=2918761 RepID=UPI0023FA4184|nr:hypothetical protein [Caballeronia sp. BR00000012568055]
MGYVICSKKAAAYWVRAGVALLLLLFVAGMTHTSHASESDASSAAHVVAPDSKSKTAQQASAAVTASGAGENSVASRATGMIDALVRLLAVVMVGATALIFASIARRRVSAVFSNHEHNFSFRRHWGGFGGSTTGWFVSSDLVQLLVAASLSIASLLLAMTIIEAAFRSDSNQTHPALGRDAPASEAAHSAQSK